VFFRISPAQTSVQLLPDHAMQEINAKHMRMSLVFHPSLVSYFPGTVFFSCANTRTIQCIDLVVRDGYYK
jgi:hypothetical protein